MPKKKKRVITVLVFFIFFGLLFLNLKYPMRSENSVKSNIMPVAYEPEEVIPENKVDKQQEEAKEPEKEEIVPENSQAEASQPDTHKTTTVKIEPKTPAKSDDNQVKIPAQPPESKPTPPPVPPKPTNYVIPSTHHFYEVRGSVDPSDKNKAELTITLNCMNRSTGIYDAQLYETQLQELRTIILPVLGEQITQEILAIAKTKTNINVDFGKFFETDTKKVSIGTSYGNPLVGFKSWQK